MITQITTPSFKNSITKRWVERKGFLGIGRKEVEITAESIPIVENYTLITTMAVISIRINGLLKMHGEFPWPLRGKPDSLPLHVFIVAKNPKYKHGRYQKRLEKFCYHCEGFDPPSPLWFELYSPYK